MARGTHKSPQRTRRPKSRKSQNKRLSLLSHNREVLEGLK